MTSVQAFLNGELWNVGLVNNHTGCKTIEKCGEIYCPASVATVIPINIPVAYLKSDCDINGTIQAVVVTASGSPVEAGQFSLNFNFWEENDVLYNYQGMIYGQETLTTSGSLTVAVAASQINPTPSGGTVAPCYGNIKITPNRDIWVGFEIYYLVNYYSY